MATVVSRREWLVVAGLLGLFLIVSLVLATRWIVPWVDEVMYTDPAWNWANGEGFRSTAWYTQGRTELWASNTPLHEILLAGWFALFGTSFEMARVSFFLYQAAGALVLTLAFRRLGLLPTAKGRIWFLLLLLAGAGIGDCLHNGRPEGIKFLVTAFAVYTLSFPAGRGRWWLLLGIGALGAWAGIQLIAYAVLLGVLLYFFVPGDVRRGLVTLVIGLGVGLGLLVGAYALLGYGMRFLEATFLSGHMMTGRVLQTVVFHNNRFFDDLQTYFSSWGYYWGFDPSYVILVGTLASVVVLRAVFRQTGQMVIVGTLGLVLLLPLLLAFSGKYGAIYAWMGFVPAALAAVVAWELSQGWPRWFAAVGLALAIAVGLPKHTVEVALQWERLDPQPLFTMVSRNVRPDEWVYTGHGAYYAAKTVAAEVFVPTYAGGRGFKVFPEDERAKVSVILGTSADVALAITRVGGHWTEVDRWGDPSTPLGTVVLRRAP